MLFLLISLVIFKSRKTSFQPFFPIHPNNLDIQKSVTLQREKYANLILEQTISLSLPIVSDFTDKIKCDNISIVEMDVRLDVGL